MQGEGKCILHRVRMWIVVAREVMLKIALSQRWQQYYLQNHKILQCDFRNSSLKSGIYILTPQIWISFVTTMMI